MSEMGRSRSLHEYRDQLRDTLGRLEAAQAALERTYEAADHVHRERLGMALCAKRDEVDALRDTLDTIENEIATRAAGSGHLPE